MDIFGLLELSQEKWAGEPFNHRIHRNIRFEDGSPIKSIVDSKMTDQKDINHEPYFSPDEKILKAEAKRNQMTEERRSSILKKYKEASNRLTLLRMSKDEKTRERQARYMTRLQSLQKVRVADNNRQGQDKNALLSSPKKKKTSGVPRPSTEYPSMPTSPVFPRRTSRSHVQTDKRDFFLPKRDVSPCRLRPRQDGFFEDKKSISRDSYNERINRMKELEKRHIEQLSSSLERKLERARVNAEMKLRSRREKAREEVRHANDVSIKLKDTLASPSRSRVHVYARESFHCEGGLNSNIPLSTDEKLQRARELAQLRLQARRQRAREEVKHAQDIARRVKAAKLLQRFIRTKILLSSKACHSMTASQHPHVSAMKRLKSWDAWKYYFMSKRLISSKIDEEWKRCLNMDLTFLDKVEMTTRSKSIPTFDCISEKLSDPTLLQTTQKFLAVFSPVLRSFDVSMKHFLCAILLSTYPDEVIGSHVAEKVRKLLRKQSFKLMSALKVMINADDDKKGAAVKAFVSALLAFLSVFGSWKHDDLQELVSSLKVNATESWVIYLTSLEALRYCSIKEKNMSPSRGHSVINVQDEGMYQYKMRYEEAQKGSRDHIKRIRCMLNRLLGEQEGFTIMKEAKAVATKQLDEAETFQRVKDDVDELCRAPPVEEPSATGSSDIRASEIEDSIKNITQSLSGSNVEFVHRILLMDQEDWMSRSLRREGEPCIDDCETFFESWSADSIVTGIEQQIQKTFEKAFFDKIYHDMQGQNLSSIQSLLTTLASKVNELVPHNVTYQNQFEHIKRHVISSTSLLDLLTQLMTIGHLLGSLESPAQSPSTNSWSSATHSYLYLSPKALPFHAKNVAEYILISTVFLLQKAELCHIEILEFKISTVAPIIQQHGPNYERTEFQKSHVPFASLKVSDVPATWVWINKLNDIVQSPAQYDALLRERGFVDEILFAKDSLALPEVLYLDQQHIAQIRHVSKCCVILSTLYLHGCNICGVRSNHVEPHLASQEVVACKKEMFALLGEYKSPNIVEKIEAAMIKLVEAASGRTMDTRAIQLFRNHCTGVLNGEDKVMRLLDNRIRNLFRTACKFQASGFPVSMITGSRNNDSPNESNNAIKTAFKHALSREAVKVGFAICTDELVEAGYLAYKVIDLSLQLYKNDVFVPLLKSLQENPPHV